MNTLRGGPSLQVAQDERWLLALVRDPGLRSRLVGTFRNRLIVRIVSSIEEAEGALDGTRELPVAALIEFEDAAGRSTIPLVRSLTSRRPVVPVVGVCAANDRGGREILEFAQAGVHELLFVGAHESTNALARIIATAQQVSAADEITSVLADTVPDKVMAFVQYCLRHPELATVNAIADALSIHRKTLFVQCSGANLPPPSVILGWCRLLLASHLLGKTHRSVESIALDLDFASVNAMRNMLKRYTGMRPGEVRSLGGLEAVIPPFLRALHRTPSTRATPVTHVA
ncbi:MAG: helix-turn-helix domain-containing protein [bacterium]